MKTLSNFLNRIANWKSLLLFFGLYMVFAGIVLKNAENKITALAGKPVGVIDLTFGFNPQKTMMMVAEYGDEARSYYALTEMTTDMLYPVVYAFLFGIILAILYRGSSRSWVSTLPFVCLLFDYLENITIVILLTTFPQQSLFIATLCELLKLLKWLAFAAVILLILLGLISKATKRIKHA